MFKKGNNIFSLLIIILSVFMTSSINIVKAADSGTGTDPTTATKWGDSLITKAELQNPDGTPLTDASTNKTMRAYWEFATKTDGQIHAGDTMTVQVPEQLAVSNDISGEIYQIGDSSQAIGSLYLHKDTKTMDVVFNQHAEDLSKTSKIVGSFWIDSLSWDVNTDFSKPIVLNWTTKGNASNPGLSSTVDVSKPTLPDNKEILFKYGGFEGTNIAWTVRINYRKDNIENAIYKDTIGPNQKLLIDDTHKLVAYPATFDPDTGAETDDTSNGSIIKNYQTNNTGFTADLGDINQTIILKYYTQVTDATDSSQMSSEYGNTGDLLSNTTELQNITANLTTNKLGGSASVNKSITAIVGTKIWNVPEGTTHPDQVTVDLLKNSQKVDSQTVSATNNWNYGFYNLYQYDDNGDTNTYAVQEEPIPGFTGTVVFPDSTQSTTLQNIVNTLTPDLTKFTVKKVWNDGKNQDDHESIDLGVYDNDGKRPSDYDKNAVDSATLSKDNNWTFTFDNLPKLTAPNRWYVSELNTPANYISTDSYNYGNNYDKVVTNTLATGLTVNKVWNDKETTHNPVKVQLYQNDNNQGDTALGNPVTLNSDNSWTHAFEITDPNDSTKTTTKLPAYDTNGKQITYSAKEVDVPDGYTSSISFDSNDKTKETITNTPVTTPTDNTREFTVNKNWSDNNSPTRPNAITVHLTANGDKIGDPVTIKPDSSGNWSYTWKNLAKNDDNGKAISYSATEDPITGYDTNVDVADNDTSATITNTLKSTPTTNKTTFQVSKIWNDNNNANRPTSIQAQLLADGKASGPVVTLNEANHWTYNWDNLDKTINDKNIKYTVEEVNTPTGYTSSITYPSSTTATITNTLPNSGGNTGDTSTNLNVTKTWSDSNNQDNLRPDHVTVHLLKNGTEVDSATLNADNNWNHNFTGLDKTATYTISEDKVADYTTNIDPTDANNVQIINTHTPTTTTTTDDKTNLTVKKSWNDQNNQDKLRPNQVTIHLLKNGTIIGQPITLSSLNAWSYTWNDLDKNGKYTVQEDNVPDYSSSQNIVDGVITITNTHNVTKTPGNPGTPTIPGGNTDTPGGSLTGNNGGNGDQTNTGNSGSSDTTTDYTPANPMVPSPIYQNNDLKNSLLPQTGSKDANIIYSILGFLILGFIAIFTIKRKQA